MKSFRCSYCKEVYYRNDHLRNHVGRAHPGEELPPPLRPRKSVSVKNVQATPNLPGKAVNVNNVQATPPCTVPCPYCSEICVGHAGLGEHVSRVHPGQKLSLPLQKPSLHKPVVVSSEKSGRFFKCSHCPEVYYRNDRLRNHVERTHPGKELPPPVRPRKAVSVNNVQATPARTVPCPYCSKICTGHADLGEHVSSVHPDQKLPLPLLKPSLHKPVVVSSEKSGRSFKCSHCPEVYYRNDRLRNHVERTHPGEELPPPLKPRKAVSVKNSVQATPPCTVQCPYCSEICTGHDGLGEHVSRVHPGQKLSLPALKPPLQKPVIRKRPKKRPHADTTEDSVQGSSSGLEHTECSEMGTKRCRTSEASTISQKKRSVMKKTHWLIQKFKSFKEFEEWKEHEEDATTSRFVKSGGDVKTLRHTYRRYVCHRSGHCRKMITRKKRMKELGSSKIGGICPAVMILKIYTAGDCEVSYHNIHQGHSCDIAHLPLRKSQREYFATLIKAGIPFNDILEKYHMKMGSTTAPSGYFVTTKDLRNILREFGIDGKKILNARVLSSHCEVTDAVNAIIDCSAVEGVDPQDISPECTEKEYDQEADQLYADIKRLMTSEATRKASCDNLKSLRSVLSSMSTSCNFPSLPAARVSAYKHAFRLKEKSTKRRKRSIKPTPTEKVLLLQSMVEEYEVASHINYSDHDYAGGFDYFKEVDNSDNLFL